MTPRDALEALRQQIPAGTSLTDALSAFVRFYASSFIEGCPKEEEADMLLFEWGGPYSWDKHFSLTLTRQFSLVADDGEYDGIQQLHMHCRYRADQVAMEGGNQWLYGDDTESFLRYVLNAPCTQAAKELTMASLDFDLHDV